MTNKKKDLSQRLTKRKLQILQLASTGLSQSLIAEQLGLSKYTVYAHLQMIYRTLGVASLQQAIHVANERQIL